MDLQLAVLIVLSAILVIKIIYLVVFKRSHVKHRRTFHRHSDRHHHWPK